MDAITLDEYSQRLVPFARLSEAQVALLQQQYASQIRIELLMAGQKQWRLSASGWVGTIPLGSNLMLVIRPKIATHRLFTMLAIAYDIDLRLLNGLIQNEAVDSLLHRLAEVLIDGILDRIRCGLHRRYVPQQDTVPFVRGRLRVRDLTQDLTALPVTYAGFSADIPHNQLLLQALALIRQTIFLPDPLHQKLTHAYRTLHGAVSLRHLTADDFSHLQYDRLTADYRPLHALCRFFIDSVAPNPAVGERDMLPFLIDMAALFEKFVACWLATHLPSHLTLTIQERSTFSNGQIQIAIDLVIKARDTNQVLCVLDTKWKSAERPSNSDLYQITFYANSRHSRAAALIYPTALSQPFATTIGNVTLRSLVFDVSAEVDHAGEQFMIHLMELVAPRDQDAKGPRRKKRANCETPQS